VKEFFGTKGWFTGFRKRTGLHTVVRHGEALDFMLFVRVSLFVVFTKERLFMVFKFTCTVYKS
jgi:hypothetical protein